MFMSVTGKVSFSASFTAAADSGEGENMSSTIGILKIIII